jgi:hypothetical protein
MIRNWVLYPIFAVMVMQGVLRHYITQLLKEPKPIDLAKLKSQQALARSRRLRANGKFLPQAAFEMRKAYFRETLLACDEEKKPADEMPQMPAQDPMAMMGQMKQSMAMIVPNMLLMGWSNYFFSGFVLLKLPFGVTERFKMMLQRGIVLQTLDTSYVTSLSFYFITMFGLRGLFSILLGAAPIDMNDPQAMMKAQSGPGAPVDFNKLMQQESTELAITAHDFAISDCEYRLLEGRFN